MLVLTRKIDQGIVISGNIYVRVLGVERDRVKIGVSAPLEVTVLRQELLEREAAEGGAGKGRRAKDEGASPTPVTGRDEPKNDVNG